MDHRYIDENNIGDLYLMGKLSAQERALFEMHFINCERCVEMLEETNSLRQALRSNWPQEILRTTSPLFAPATARPVWRTVVMACLLVLLVIVPTIFLTAEMRRLRRALEETKALYATQRESQNKVENESPTDSKPTPPPGHQSDAREKSSTDSINPAKSDEPGVEINPAIFILAAAQRGETDSTDSNEVVTDRSQKRLSILLDLEGGAEYETYRATIQKDDRHFLRKGGLRPNKHNLVAIQFRSDALPPGQYLLALEGISKTGQPAPIANYPFRVTKKSMK